MGLIDFLKGKTATQRPEPMSFPYTLNTPAKGRFVPMSQIPDEVFSAGILGTCCGVDPDEGNIFAPADGKISQLADTKHAVGIQADSLEVLIHVGVDTVDMNGDGFQSLVRLGQCVKKGDPLLQVDLEKIKAAGHPAVVIMAVTNSDDFSSVEEAASGTVQLGDSMLKVRK